MLHLTSLELLSRNPVAFPNEEIAVNNKGLPIALVLWIGPGHRYKLKRPYHIVEKGVEISVPEGFIFDAASVPRIFHIALSPVDLGVVAPLVHDWLYASCGEAGQLTRLAADRIFLKHMRLEGVSRIKRSAAFAAVVAFGRSAFCKAPS